MKSRYIYIIIAILGIIAVVYPVAYAQFTNASANQNPYLCAPLIPCQKPAPATGVCSTICYVYMRDSTFTPGTINVTIGAKVIWVNQDGFSHTSTAFNTTAWSSPVIPPGETYTLVIRRSLGIGSYYYHCNIHPPMIGLINVVSGNSTQ